MEIVRKAYVISLRRRSKKISHVWKCVVTITGNWIIFDNTIYTGVITTGSFTIYYYFFHCHHKHFFDLKNLILYICSQFVRNN